MNTELKDSLVRSIFRFKKVGFHFPPGTDLRLGELYVMRLIAENALDSAENVYAADIQNGLHVSRPAISQMLNSLEEKGYIRREIDGRDRRRLLLTLTAKGEKIMQVMKGHANRVIAEIISRFGEENTTRLIGLLNRFADISDELKLEILTAPERVTDD